MKNIRNTAAAMVVLFFSSCSEREVYPEYVFVGPDNLEFVATGGSGTFTITSKTNWSLAVDQPWIEVTPSSGRGNASITVKASGHTSQTDRTAIITVHGGRNSVDKQVTIVQNGLRSLALNLTEMNFPAAADAKSFLVNSNVAWTVSATQPWLTTSPASGSGTASVLITTAENTGTDARTAIVTVHDQHDAANHVQFVVIQAGQLDFIRVNTANLYLTSASPDDTFDVFSNISWNVRINYRDGSDWLDDIYPRSGLGNKTGVKVHVNTLPPPGETWQAEIEVYNMDKGKSEKLLVNVTN